MKKKLNGWQIALLIIFYPAGIVYLIVKFCFKEKKDPAPIFDMAKAEVETDFYSKVVGVTFKNDDGSDRQSIVRS